MKLFSAEQIREWDAFTIKQQNIQSIDLMERASLACTNWLIENGFGTYPVKIFCGKGNNGGDGLAIARLLLMKNLAVQVFILEFGSVGTDDFQENLHRLHEFTRDIYFIQEGSYLPTLEPNDVIIDAIYGSGLSRPLDGLSKLLVEHINSASARVVSIDLPSGMFVNKSSIANTVVIANYTLTFQTKKLCFLLPEIHALVGEVTVLDIGLEKNFIPENDANLSLTTRLSIESIYKPRSKFSHKGTFGHALIIGGSKGKFGAAILCTQATLRSGAGLASTLLPAEFATVMHTSCPEAMVESTDEIDAIDFEKYSSIGIGPGLGTSEAATELLFKVLNNYNKPVVLDADALNIISTQKQALKFLPPGSILTPHPKEYERLFGKSKNDFERIKTALRHAEKLHSFIVLKGHHTFIACPNGEGYFNTTGNAGMATAGSGDVLTGIITGLLAQGYSSLNAAVLGVYLHGLSGDLAAAERSEEALMATDIIEYLGKAFLTISKK